MLIDRLNDERHKLSSLCTLIMLAGVVTWAQSLKGPAEYLAHEAMELSIALIEPILQPPPKPEQSSIRPPVNLPKPNSNPNPITASPVEPIKEQTASEVSRTLSAPAPLQTAPPAPTPTPPTVSPIELPKAPTPLPASVSVENNYIASVRATLNANKRYPTGREASLQRPSGKVKVWFVLLRNGSLQDSGIDESSNSIILDNAALSTVRRTNYVPWPDSSWPNQSQHRFSVTLEFVPFN